jgi:hypothetical protein
MKRVALCALLLALGLAACGDDGPLTFPLPEGTLAEYFPLSAGSTYLYRLNGDPAQTATLSVRDSGGSLDLELVSADPAFRRIALLVRIAGDRVEVLRLDRGAVRVELDPALAALRFPLREGVSYSSSTRLRLLGGQLGVNLLGVPAQFGQHTVLDRTYPRAFSVDISIQTDLLGRSRVELVLAEGLGPVQIRVVSPAVQQLGFEGLQLQLQLLQHTGGPA